MSHIVKCPTCNKAVTWDNNSPVRPFCSDRCKLIDLGEWASESHKINGGPADFTMHTPPVEDE